jgi:class 3 adenylate cyclase
MVAWGAASLAEIGPFGGEPITEEPHALLVGFALTGLPLFGIAAWRYTALYRRRGGAVVFSVAVAFVLLAEALVVVAAASRWRISWWEWHVVMLLGFAFVAYSARREWHEERFSDLYLEETLAGARDVSILFADLQGFTRFSERTDPAEVAEMLNGYFDVAVPKATEVYGGEVHQLIGDAIMVVFNKDGGAPDHAEAAARAALALQRDTSELAARHDGWPRFRVGVNTGEVFAGVRGARGKREHGVIGDPVNVAARLEAQARVGEVVIGAETLRRLPDDANVEPLGALPLKGREQPVEAYVLRSLRGHGEPGGVG